MSDVPAPGRIHHLIRGWQRRRGRCKMPGQMGSKRLQLLTSGLLCAGGAALVAFGYFFGGGAAIAVGVFTAIQVLIARNR